MENRRAEVEEKFVRIQKKRSRSVILIMTIVDLLLLLIVIRFNLHAYSPLVFIPSYVIACKRIELIQEQTTADIESALEKEFID